MYSAVRIAVLHGVYKKASASAHSRTCSTPEESLALPTLLAFCDEGFALQCYSLLMYHSHITTSYTTALLAATEINIQVYSHNRATLYTHRDVAITANASNLRSNDCIQCLCLVFTSP